MWLMIILKITNKHGLNLFTENTFLQKAKKHEGLGAGWEIDYSPPFPQTF